LILGKELVIDVVIHIQVNFYLLSLDMCMPTVSSETDIVLLLVSPCVCVSVVCLSVCLSVCLAKTEN